jgi:hypothetical protein
LDRAAVVTAETVSILCSGPHHEAVNGMLTESQYYVLVGIDLPTLYA